MKKADFYGFWNKKYADLQPVSAYFWKPFQSTWFRIHSLPESKRYANTLEEYEEIFYRQNTLLNEFIPQNTQIQIVINYIESSNELFEIYNFENIGVLICDEVVYQSFVMETSWQTNCINDILKAIADDEIKGFIIAPKALIAPYDGGMNFYLKDITTKEFFKNKYKMWLSSREDGM
jgi:hypothetical protein